MISALGPARDGAVGALEPLSWLALAGERSLEAVLPFSAARLERAIVRWVML